MFTVTIRPFPGVPTTFNATEAITVGDALSRANAEYNSNFRSYDVKVNGEKIEKSALTNQISTDTTINVYPAKGKVKGNK